MNLAAFVVDAALLLSAPRTKHVAALGVMLSLVAGVSSDALAGDSPDGKHYTNFGNDLRIPIFPKDGTLALYKNKDDAKPTTVMSKIAVLDIADGNWKECIRSEPKLEWVRCKINGNSAWVKRASFTGPQEATPVDEWAIRYWLYVASSGMGGEETDSLYRALPRSPYLIKPKQFGNIFFLVHFDRHGNAISPKTSKSTGDRVFMVGNAVYLAPAAADKRTGARWLFLGYYNAALRAMCPGEATESCKSAVSQDPAWTGIKTFYTKPANAPSEPVSTGAAPAPVWYGAQEVAFARHDDPAQAFIYGVPLEVKLASEGNSTPVEQMNANRAKPFCLVDCKGAANAIILDPAPGLR